MKHITQKYGVKKGNLYDHLDEDETHWLIDEAFKNNTDMGTIVASIVKDAYYEEKVSDILSLKCLNHKKH
jgi:hypothetical protein|tara:strand:- start:240 stop:449 length:210 start_codon:yes stop_codon:yes gene_type:complete